MAILALVIIIDGVLFPNQTKTQINNETKHEIEMEDAVNVKFQARLKQHISSKYITLTQSGYVLQADVSRGISKSRKSKYTSEEIEMAKWIVQQEVMGGSLEHKIIITQVLVNRLNNSYWGDTLKEVMLAEGQFPSKVNWFKKINPPDQDTEKAIELVLCGNCEDISQGALYFYNPKWVKDRATINWFESLVFLFELEDHRFFREKE